jgi:DNA sulfur modification protein DndC
LNEYQRKVIEAKAHLLRMYLDETDERDWAVAWSGGKDSTAVLGLMVEVLSSLPPEKRKRRVRAVMSDTKAENPELEAYMHDQVTKLNAYAKHYDLPIDATIVSRPIKHSYFVLTLGRGYFMPLNNGQGRWCTDRLKIQPVNEKLRDINPSFILIGTRTSESTKRKQSIEKWTEDAEVDAKIGRHVSLPDSRTFMVIVDFDVEDVWRYLSENKLGWTSTAEVRRLYKEATGECGINNPQGVDAKAKEMEGCGARFGCWLCPVVLNDKSTEGMSRTHLWMEPLTEWRVLQMKAYGQYVPPRPAGQKRSNRGKDLRKWEAINERIKLITKSGYNRQGKRMKDGQGTFTVEARKWLFDLLMETQALMNRMRKMNGLEPIALISDEEVALIKSMWADDEATANHVVTNAAGVSISELGRLIDGDFKQ